MNNQNPDDKNIIEYSIYKNISNIIFSSLDIETVLENLSKYLMQFFSHTGISVQIIDFQENELSVLADTRLGKTQRMQKSFKFDEHLAQMAVQERRLPSPQHFIPCICNNSEENTPLKGFLSFFWNKPTSVILIPLLISEHSYFLLTIYSLELTQYTEKDLQLCTIIRQPLTLAFANILEYEKINEKKRELERQHTTQLKQLSPELRDILDISFEGIQSQIETLPHIAQSDSTVLILGETGVGKDVFAHAIHQLSKRHKKAFVKVNCGAIPDNLIDSALFGYTKGAFTGANALQIGYFEQAQDGVLFLDEIGELPLSSQARLLQVLQFKEIHRVGSPLPIKLNIRIIAATHRNLQAMVREGTFREDLWYRLNIIPIFIPPLRERRKDLAALTRLIIKKKCHELNISQIPRLNTDNFEQLSDYPWTGNIRELENLIERTLILQTSSASIQLNPQNDLVNQKEEKNDSKSNFNLTNYKNKISKLDEVISQHIINTLEYTNGKIQGQNGAANLLGLAPSTLRSKLRKLNIPRHIKYE